MSTIDRAAPEAPRDWINHVVRDIAELPDRDSPDGQPDMMLVTVNELHDIIGRHAPTGAAPEAPTLNGMRILVDPTMPPNTIRLESGEHSVTITNIDFGASTRAAPEAPVSEQQAGELTCAMCNDSGIVGYPPDQYEECPDCIKARAATTASASGELLPCPFCGSTNIDPAEWSGNDGKAGPGCGDCGALADAAASWNRRATAPSRDAGPLSKAEVDAIVYQCRQSGDDSTYAIVNAALAQQSAAQAAHAGAAPQWQPIAEAPRDGTRFWYLQPITVVSTTEPPRIKYHVVEVWRKRTTPDGEGYWTNYATSMADHEVCGGWFLLSDPLRAAMSAATKQGEKK